MLLARLWYVYRLLFSSLSSTNHPQLHHLGGIGYILGSVMEGSLSEASYQRVRTLL